MKDENQNSRRSFIKRISATGIASIGLSDFSFASKEKLNKKDNATILFQGDSITDGNRSRNNDWNHVMGHGYAYLISSRMWFDNPERHFHFFNRGISGNKIEDLADRWQSDTLDVKPDVLSILIGVNDVDSAVNSAGLVSPKQYENGYRSLLKQTKEQILGIEIVICEPFILPVGRVKNNWERWSAEIKIKQASAEKLAAEFNAIYVPLQDEFEQAVSKAPAEYWIWDGIHPMPAGHELIARKWISIVKKKSSYI